jgi:hypothetical protein
VTILEATADLTSAEVRLLRSLREGDVVLVTRAELITVAQVTEHGRFPHLIDSEGNIARDLASAKLISRAPRPLEEGQVRAADLLGATDEPRYIEHILPGLGLRRCRVTKVAEYLGLIRVTFDAEYLPGHTVPVVTYIRPEDPLRLHSEPE